MINPEMATSTSKDDSIPKFNNDSQLNQPEAIGQRPSSTTISVNKRQNATAIIISEPEKKLLIKPKKKFKKDKDEDERNKNIKEDHKQEDQEVFY